MKFVFIINPISGKVQYQNVVDIVKLYAKEHPEFEYDLVLTEYSGHAKEIAQTYPNPQNCCFVACGGDGTLNEVLNGLPLEACLAQVPIGSGNDFFKMLGFENQTDLEKIVLGIITGKVVHVDYGQVNGERFINSCNMGLDADVLIEFNKNRGKIPNNLLYPYATLKTIIKPITHFNAIDDLTNNKLIKDNMMLLTVMNGCYYGNGFTPTPMADIQDGYFDVCWVEKMSLLKISIILPKFKKGHHTTEKKAHFFKSQHLIITSNDGLRYALDGELRQANRIDIENKAGQLKFVVLQDSNLK